MVFIAWVSLLRAARYKFTDVLSQVCKLRNWQFFLCAQINILKIDGILNESQLLQEGKQFVFAVGFGTNLKASTLNQFTLHQVRYHEGVNFSRTSNEERISCLDRDSFTLRHQRGSLLWKSLRLLRCVQKPETSLAVQHVCGSTGRERYFNLYLLHAFFSCNSVPRQVDFRRKFLPISRIHIFYIFNDFSSHHGNNRCQPIFLHRQTRKVHRVIQQTKDSRVHCRCVLRGSCWICASTFLRRRRLQTKTRTSSMHVRIWNQHSLHHLCWMCLYCYALITYHILLYQSVLHGITVKPNFSSWEWPSAASSKRGRSESDQDSSDGDGWFRVLLDSDLCNGLHRRRARGTESATRGRPYIRVLGLPEQYH